MTNPFLLHSIRILDFTWVLAGPYATRLLADFGAEVIKVQPPHPTPRDAFSRGYYNTWNRNKLGVTLNLDKPEGIGLAKKLVSVSDAVVENFAPRVMANWGLDYESLKKIKPDIIMVSLSTMGQTGPWRDYVGFGPTVHAFSGMTHLTAYPGGAPLGPGFSYADHVAGLYASLALLGALEHRRRTGEGQYIDISQTEAMASLMGEAILEFTARGREPHPAGNRAPEAAPYGVYPCQGNDRWCAITVLNEAEWGAFKRALGNPPWAESEKFAGMAARLQNTAELDTRIAAWTQEHSAEEVMASLQREGVPAGVVQNARDLANDPHLKSRRFFIPLAQPGPGQTMCDASPIRLSETPLNYRHPAPRRGQDNDYVFGKLLGLSVEEMGYLRRKKVI